MRGDELRLVVKNDQPGVAVAKPDMRACAVEVSKASVQYPIGPYVRGSVKANLMQMFGKRGEKHLAAQFVNALTSVSFNVTHGERVGLIGSNGSGKSTLLRAIAGIFPLISGDITVRGQIGTLLDVALGFEPESTGRENIYYRGMAMGVSPSRLKEVENEIVAFANLGPFIDLPMRTYSAGMWVRLGFAISTQLSPDVLLIDEIFGAGDAAFQERAVERMNRIVANAGIVIIATHDLGLIERVCTRAIWVGGGEIQRDGPPYVVIPQYVDHVGNRGR